MIGPDEYDRLKKRKFKPYSKQHQQMYRIIVELLRGTPVKILEVGYGIGYGLDRFVDCGAINKYIGFEESRKCHAYVSSKHPDDRIEFYCGDFASLDASVLQGFADVTICIEVIEHVESDLKNFIKNLREVTAPGGVLFLSHPSIEVESHGRFTNTQVARMLRDVGFGNVVWHSNQKPHTLFMAQ